MVEMANQKTNNITPIGSTFMCSKIFSLVHGWDWLTFLRIIPSDDDAWWVTNKIPVRYHIAF